MKKQTSLFRIIIVLALISSVISASVAAVNYITEDKIAQVENEKKEDAIKSIFSDAEEVELVNGEFSKSVNGVYEIKKDGQTVGYTVDIVTVGFGGDVTLMVGITAELKVMGVCVTDHGETPGVGSKVENKSFLDLLTEENRFEAISGATISSNAVKNGVDEAVGVITQLIKEGE